MVNVVFELFGFDEQTLRYNGDLMGKKKKKEGFSGDWMGFDHQTHCFNGDSVQYEFVGLNHRT